MPILIDAWNLIRDEASGIPDYGEDALETARTLILWLEKFQETHKDPIVCVFDSKREFLNFDYQKSPDISIVATKDADLYIRNYIDDIPERLRRNLRVVSSDNAIYYYSKQSRAIHIRCAEFWDKLKTNRLVLNKKKRVLP